MQEICVAFMKHSRVLYKYYAAQQKRARERDGSCQCLALIMLYVCAERSSPNTAADKLFICFLLGATFEHVMKAE